MSTILNTNGTSVQVPVLNKKVAGKFYVITADWNSKITYALRDAAAGVLRRAGVEKDKIIQLSVPGTVELVNAAALALKTGKSPSASCSADATEGVIVIGCVIRGDTPISIMYARWLRKAWLNLTPRAMLRSFSVC